MGLEFASMPHMETAMPTPDAPPRTAIERRLEVDIARIFADEPDPTPWCNGCGAKRQADCHCGPLAEND
jgi:hypothetical protein